MIDEEMGEMEESVTPTEEEQFITEDVNTEQIADDITGEVEDQSPEQGNDEVDGLRQGIQAEREKRQKLEGQNEYLQNMISQQQQPAQSEETGYDPEEYIPAGEVKNLIAEEINGMKSQFRAQTVQGQVEDCKARYSDWDEVYKYAIDLETKSPGLGDALLNTPNPAESAYNLGRSHPDYIKKMIENGTKSTIDKMNQNANSTSLASARSGQSKSMDNADAIGNLSDDDFEKLVQSML